jgi:hypothetical protein
MLLNIKKTELLSNYSANQHPTGGKKYQTGGGQMVDITRKRLIIKRKKIGFSFVSLLSVEL